MVAAEREPVCAVAERLTADAERVAVPAEVEREAPLAAVREPAEAEREAVAAEAERRMLALPKVRSPADIEVERLAEAPPRPIDERGCKSRALVTLREELREAKLFSGCNTA